MSQGATLNSQRQGERAVDFAPEQHREAKGEKMQKTNSDPRIAAKFSGDRLWSLAAIIVLWVLYAFVFYEIKDYAGSSEVIWALVVAGALVILFNTAAILAMLFHLSEERDEIYGLDLHYLDLKKK
jgi:hypothetical protein